jgi:hypothetical protein
LGHKPELEKLFSEVDAFVFNVMQLEMQRYKVVQLWSAKLAG